jgi:hypothetical protein
MKIYFFGGIGNVLFQVSFAKCLSDYYSSEIDFTYIEGNHDSSFQETLSSLNFLGKNRKSKKNLKFIIQKLKFKSFLFIDRAYINLETRIRDLEILSRLNVNNFLGYFQNLELAKWAREDISKLLSDYDYSTWFYEMESRLKIENPIAVHVRRGDYLISKDFHGVLSQEYYSNAMKLFSKNEMYWVFSDDVHLAKLMLSPMADSRRIQYITHPNGVDPIESLKLFSLTKAQIIANSTFSWWGAFLANESETTVAPRQWFASREEFEFDFPMNWKVLESSWEL